MHLLRNHRFLALWSGNAFSLTGNAGVRIAYPLLALALFGSPSLAGWVTFAATLPALILQIPAGILADTVNRRLLLLVAQAAGLAGTCAVLAATVLHLPWTAAVLVLGAVLEGSAFVFFGTAEVNAVRDVVAPEQRPVAFSFLEAEQPIANLAGRALGGLLFDLSRRAPFVFNAFSYAFSLVTLALMPGRLFDAAEKSEPPRLLDGLAWTWRSPFLRLTTLVAGFTNILFQCVILTVLVVGTRDDRPAWTAGVILAAAGVGGLLGSVLAPRFDRRLPPWKTFLGCVWCWTGCSC